MPMQWLPSPLQVRPLIPAVSLPQQRPVAQPKQSHVAQNQIQLQVRQPAFRIPTAQRRPIAQLPMHVVQDLVNTTQQQKQYPALLSAIPFHPILLRFNLSNAGFHLLSAQEHLLFVPPQTHIPQLPLQNVPNQILIGMLFSKPFAADSSSESGTSAAVGPKHPVDLVAIPTTRNLFLSVRALTARDFGIGQSRTSTAIGMPTFAQLQTAALHCGTCHTGLQCGAMQTATWQNGALQTAALRFGARQTGFQCGTMQIANMPTRLRGSDPNSAMGMSALREITPPVWQQPGIGKGTEMPLFVGRQRVLSQRAVNLPVTSVAAEFGGLALQGQAGTGLPVSLAAPLRTHGQRELMAQVNGPYLEESAICPVRFLKEEAKSSGARVPSSKTCATELLDGITFGLQCCRLQTARLEWRTLQAAVFQPRTWQTAALASRRVQTSSMQCSTLQTSTLQSIPIQSVTLPCNTLETATCQCHKLQTSKLQRRTMHSATLQGRTMPTTAKKPRTQKYFQQRCRGLTWPWMVPLQSSPRIDLVAFGRTCSPDLASLGAELSDEKEQVEVLGQISLSRSMMTMQGVSCSAMESATSLGPRVLRSNTVFSSTSNPSGRRISKERAIKRAIRAEKGEEAQVCPVLPTGKREGE